MSIAMPEKRPTGFSDLLLEIRQMIYGYILPEDRIMNYSSSYLRRDGEKTVHAVCEFAAVHGYGDIYYEMKDCIHKVCSVHLTNIPDKKVEMPMGFQFDRFQRITIDIDSTQDSDYGRTGIGQLIAMSRCGYPKQLPDISIEFLDDYCWMQKVSYGSVYYWRDPYDERGESDCEEDDGLTRDIPPEHRQPEDKWRTVKWLRHDPRSGNPHVVSILDSILALPPCNSATVDPIGGLRRNFDVEPYDPWKRIFNQEFMDDLCGALEPWLEGERHGVDLPKWPCSVSNATRLEQLAYQEHEGYQYCSHHPGCYWPYN